MPIKNLQPLKILLGLLLFISFSCKKSDTSLASVHSENFKAIGASANDLLSSAKFTSIKLEIQYMPGYVPDAASINNAINFLNNLVNKPGGITGLTQVRETQ